MFLLLLLLSMVTFLIRYNLQEQFKFVEESLTETKGEHRPLIAKVNEINHNIASFESIQEHTISKSEIIVHFSQLVPEGIVVTFFSISPSNVVQINGIFEKRQTLLDFRETIEEEFLVNLDFPISNILNKEENGTFFMKGNIAEDILTGT